MRVSSVEKSPLRIFLSVSPQKDAPTWRISMNNNTREQNPEQNNLNSILRKIPRMDTLLAEPDMCRVLQMYGKKQVMDALNRELDSLRKAVLEGACDVEPKDFTSYIMYRAMEVLKEQEEKHFCRVINATGVVLHTNLGRAPLPRELVAKVACKLSGYSNLEYDLSTGQRGERYSHFEQLICQVTGAEASFAVNNNAAAVLLMMSALGAGREIIVSRGEQIEIGGKFRIPDIMDRSGCRRVEVGTTNKTRISDYEEHIGENTAALLKVHTSNFHIEGFTESVSREELVALSSRYGLPVIEDLGSGVLIDLSKYGLKKEPTVMDSLKAGVDLVTFSGDKLLGGPQAGIIAGKKKWIDLCKKHPLTRAVRIDKFSAAMLEEIFALYRNEEKAVNTIPVLAMLTADRCTLEKKAAALCHEIKNSLEIIGTEEKALDIRVVECESTAGGGSLPGEVLPSAGVYITGKQLNVEQLVERLRTQPVPVITRIIEDGLLLDVRTVFDDELSELAQIIKQCLHMT